MKVLVINSGSSSLKFTLFDMTDKSILAKGLVERIGMDNPKMVYQPKGEKFEEILTIKNHSEALKSVCDKLVNPQNGVLKSLSEVEAIGHRVLHGGMKYTAPIIVNEAVKDGIRACIPLGPLHNPANLGGIEACEQVFPGVPNVAVFDTAFHQTMGPEAYMYAIPREYYEKYSVRKYGFHGTSHKFVYYNTCEFLGLDPAKAKIINCHLGNGSSLCAVNGGKVLDTSMGLTPLMGLVMGTRCGDMDPAVVPFLMKMTGMTAEQMDTMMNKKSGFLGVSGVSSDCRELDTAIAEGNERAKLALKIFTHDVIKIIGSYIAEMDGVDLIVFTAGIGENNPRLRRRVCENFGYMGLKFDYDANAAPGDDKVISAPDSKVKVMVVSTNEELVIARDTMHLVLGNEE